MAFASVMLAARCVDAEPRISTTANRAVAMAPWPVWLLGLAAFAFLVYPLITRRLLRVLGVSNRWWLRGVVGLSLLHCGAGILTLDAMVLASVGYSDASPLLFVAVWLAFVGLATAAYCVLARRYTGDAGRSVAG